jgi:hypothetical protein
MPSDRRVLASRPVSATAAAAALAAVLVLPAAEASAHPGAWQSGVRTNPDAPGFATWRGTPLKVIVGFIRWRNGWSEMYTYASGSDIRWMRSKSSNVSLGHALFPAGHNAAACASGAYDDEHANVASRLVANGAGDAEIRLGWEANGDWYPWSIDFSNPAPWKDCFTRVAKVFKSKSANFRIAWSMNKKGRGDVRTAWPDGAPITSISVNAYDDPWVRFGAETFNGGPWGLRAWAAFARGKGKKLGIGEWALWLNGDNPQFIQNMHDFFEAEAGTIAHEAYFNGNAVGEHRLYPSTIHPEAAARYRELF